MSIRVAACDARNGPPARRPNLVRPHLPTGQELEQLRKLAAPALRIAASTTASGSSCLRWIGPRDKWLRDGLEAGIGKSSNQLLQFLFFEEKRAVSTVG